jgi:hypothetical protein
LIKPALLADWQYSVFSDCDGPQHTIPGWEDGVGEVLVGEDPLCDEEDEEGLVWELFGVSWVVLVVSRGVLLDVW